MNDNYNTEKNTNDFLNNNTDKTDNFENEVRQEEKVQNATSFNNENQDANMYSNSYKSQEENMYSQSYRTINQSDNAYRNTSYNTSYNQNQSQEPTQNNSYSSYASSYNTTRDYGDNFNTTQSTPQNNVYSNIPQSNYRYTQNDNTPKKEKKKRGNGTLVAAVAICILGSGVLGFAGGVAGSSLNPQTTDNGLTVQKVVNTAEGVSEDTTTGGMTTQQVAEAVADTVVEITTETVQTGGFSSQYIESGAGSGVIISESGYIVTNNHVIEDATKITVTLKNGESYEAEFVGTGSPDLDIALIKIDAPDLKAAVLGDSDNLSVGEDIVVIGNPLGQLGGTVTNGIISSLSRDVEIEGVTMNLLQTNAAINPGNSGGGMFNDKGELVGIVVAKSTGDEVEGLGFVIPINQVDVILEDLTEYGYVRGNIRVGMSLVDVTTEQMAMMYNVENTGVYIQTISEASSAQSAGLRVGDRIVSIDGKEVNTADEVISLFAEYEVGTVVKITVERNGQTGTLDLTLTEDIPDAVKEKDAFESSENTDDIGSYFDSLF